MKRKSNVLKEKILSLYSVCKGRLDKELADFDENSVIRIFKIFSALALLVALYAFVFSGFQIVDEFEHLHAAWLVSSGEVPYRDFFEHHNPLLWYISAPVVRLFYDNAIIFYVMRAVSFGVSVLTLFFIYKTALYFTSKIGAWFAVALTLGNIITLYNFSQFRPDNFMNCCFIIGVYYLLAYLKQKQLKLLIFSFLGFTFSALFLQKISLLLIVVEVILLVLLFGKKISFRHITVAAIPALLVAFGFLLLLYLGNTLLQYFELNLHFNQAMLSYFDRGAFWLGNIFFSFYGLILIFGLYIYRKQNLNFKIIFWLFAAEFLMRNFYFAPHPNYYTLLVMLSALVFAPCASLLFPKYKIISLFLIILTFLHLGLVFNTIDATSAKHNSYKHYLLADYVHKNSQPDDYLMNGYDKNFNIYRKDVSYYWFGLDMLLPIMELEYNISQKPDVNRLIIQYRPKFIYVQNYPDLRAYRSYGESRYSQVFIPELVWKLYQKTPFENLAVLK